MRSSGDGSRRRSMRASSHNSLVGIATDYNNNDDNNNNNNNGNYNSISGQYDQAMTANGERQGDEDGVEQGGVDGADDIMPNEEEEEEHTHAENGDGRDDKKYVDGEHYDHGGDADSSSVGLGTEDSYYSPQPIQSTLPLLPSVRHSPISCRHPPPVLLASCNSLDSTGVEEEEEEEGGNEEAFDLEQGERGQGGGVPAISIEDILEGVIEAGRLKGVVLVNAWKYLLWSTSIFFFLQCGIRVIYSYSKRAINLTP